MICTRDRERGFAKRSANYACGVSKFARASTVSFALVSPESRNSREGGWVVPSDPDYPTPRPSCGAHRMSVARSVMPWGV